MHEIDQAPSCKHSRHPSGRDQDSVAIHMQGCKGFKELGMCPDHAQSHDFQASDALQVPHIPSGLKILNDYY